MILKDFISYIDHNSIIRLVYKTKPGHKTVSSHGPVANEWNDVENPDVDSTSTSVTLNENGILIKEQNKEEVDKEVKSVKISKDGITIKTK